MDKNKFAILGAVAALTVAFATPACAFSLGAAMNDIGKASMAVTAASPLASLDGPFGRSADARQCAPLNCASETLRGNVRFSVFRVSPDREIFTGSVPTQEKSRTASTQFPAFELGLGTRSIWPPLLQVNAKTTFELLQPGTRHAQQTTATFLNI